MSLDTIRDVVAGALLVMGAGFAFVAAVGIVRFPDLLRRMHAATKPQTFGVLLILAGLALRIESVSDLTLVAVVAMFQLLTAPVSAHMVGRAAFRAGQVDRDQLTIDEAD